MNKEKRTLVIADIHGAKKALEQVLERCNYNSEEDKLIFLGDYSDGWGETAELISLLIEIKNKATHKPIFIMGNHDDWTRDWILYGKVNSDWLPQGGQATYDSYMRTGLNVNMAHKEFYENLLPYYIDEQNRAFVHGGFTSSKGLGHEPFETNYWWDRDMWSLAIFQHSNYLEEDVDERVRDKVLRFLKHKEVYIGHTSTEMFKIKPYYPEYKDVNQNKEGNITVPMNRCNVWNLDTGCGWSGKLTIMDINTKEYWQSDLVTELYSEEKGRRG